MKRERTHLALAAILMMTSCSLIGPKCQRLKLSDYFRRDNKNVQLVEYTINNKCVPTLAGYQNLYNLEYENPNENYYWNHKQCKWITESEMDSLINESLDKWIAELEKMDSLMNESLDSIELSK